MKTYKTIRANAVAEHVVKRSRFVAQAFVAGSPEMAQEQLAAVRKAHREASHHTYAYIAGENGQWVKFSDDGEPSGTAGAVILDALRKRDIQNVLVTVSRYFGGVLLGAGGLSRAYGAACAAALDKAGTCTVVPCEKAEITCAYAHVDKVERYLKSRDGVLWQDAQYGQSVRIGALVRTEAFAAVCAELSDLLLGNAELISDGKTMVQWP